MTPTPSHDLLPCQVEQGDYVLATKFTDGDFADAWAIGFYDRQEGDRHFVKDGNGTQCRIGGYRRVAKVTNELGEWLYNNRVSLEKTSPNPEVFNLWMIYDAWMNRAHPTSTPKASKEVMKSLDEEEFIRRSVFNENMQEPYTRKKIDWWWLEWKLRQKKMVIVDLEQRIQAATAAQEKK